MSLPHSVTFQFFRCRLPCAGPKPSLSALPLSLVLTMAGAVTGCPRATPSFRRRVKLGQVQGVTVGSLRVLATFQFPSFNPPSSSSSPSPISSRRRKHHQHRRYYSRVRVTCQCAFHLIDSKQMLIILR
ncbi:hypothetical protein RB213_000614 [Colletotrichum asianum]